MIAQRVAAASVMVLSACALSHQRDREDPTDAAPSTRPDTGRTSYDAGPTPHIPWMPPFPVDDVDEEGLCLEYPGAVRAADIWAWRDRVFVVADTPVGSSLQVRDGAGAWTTWFTHEHDPGAAGEARVTGGSDGVPWLWGGDCWLRRVTGPRRSICVLSSPPTGSGALVDAHMRSTDDGWLLAADYMGPWPGVFRFRGGDVVHEGPLNASAGDSSPVAIWGDAVGWFALVRTDLYARGGPAVGPRSDVPGGLYSAFWAHGRDEQWIGTRAGRLLYFDGLGWEARGRLDAAIEYIWGASPDSPFIASPRGLAQWTAEDGVAELLSWELEALTVEGLHGSGDVAYLLLVDRRHSTDGCGDAFVLMYADGRFRRI